MYYFAYGLNLSKEQMRELCPNSRPGFKVTLPNYKLVFAGWNRRWRGGVAGIRLFGGEKVIGAVYEISEVDLRRLDRYEGYPADCNRLNIRVFNEDGDLIDALTYIMTRQTEETQPSPEYLTALQQGYREWGII
jgi:gamma-glutamylcyclotransferase